MTDRVPPDRPTDADVARLRSARRTARAVIAAAEARCMEEWKAAFRRELASTVRSVSPFLVSLAAANGLTLEDVVARLDWSFGWPKRPGVSEAMRGWAKDPHLLRHAAASGATVARVPGGPEGPHGCSFRVASGGSAEVRVIAHSIEVSLRIGSLTFETRFGELLLHVRGGLPLTLAAGALGRPIDDFVLHPAVSGRGWRVDAVERRGSDTTLVVVTGCEPCRLR